ncbi:MAG: rhomboid family intramembrane serine protease [Bacteroidaceae bacterium]
MNNFPTVTKHLLILNVLMFAITTLLQTRGVDLTDYLGLHFILASQFNPAQLVTYLFMHGSFSHLFFNMFAIWMFGRLIENKWGFKRYIIFYFLCGIGAGLIQEATQYIYYLTELQHFSQVDIGNDLVIPMTDYLNRMNTIGASGAVFGVLLAFGMTWPDSKLYMFPIPVPVRSIYLIGGYAIIELIAGVSNNSGDYVAHFAHLGGMLIGLIIILYWRKKDKKNGQYTN